MKRSQSDIVHRSARARLGVTLNTNFQQRFRDRVVLVTGSSTGIGAAIAERLADEGASVAVNGRRADVLEAKAAELSAKGRRIIALPGDVSTDASGSVNSTVECFGRLDVLVNNAAISAGREINEMTLDGWRQVMAVNLDAAFELVRYSLPHLFATQGNILHISSISTVTGEFDDAAYAASKSGLEGFSRKLALEVAHAGVRSNVIRPGLIMTEAFTKMPPDFFESQVPMIPLAQIGRPDDIASAAAFLCSDEARFITGAILAIDGGESAK